MQPLPDVTLGTVNRESAVEKLQSRVVDLSRNYYFGLEDAFPAVESALISLDTSRTTIGAGAWFQPSITEAERSYIIGLAHDQTMLAPQRNLYGGVEKMDLSSQIWLRLLFHTFKDTRLWNEYIAPHFNHALFEPILRNREFFNVCPYDIFNPRDMRFGVQTERTLTANILTQLAFRSGLDLPDYSWGLRNAVIDEIESKHGLKSIKDNETLWRELFEKYWIENEGVLFPEELLEFMEGRRLVRIDIDTISPYLGDSVAKQFRTKDALEYVLAEVLNRRIDRKPFSNDIIINRLMDTILAHVFQMVYVGERQLNEELVSMCINTALDGRVQKYFFAAAVKEEYLVK
jgi:hypothetical protein